MTLQQFFDSIYSLRKLLGRSQSTTRLYNQTIRNFRKYLGREPLLSDLNDDTVVAYLAAVIGKVRSPHTVSKERSQLLALANYAAKKKLLPEFLDVPLIPVPDDAPRAPRVEEIAALLAQCSHVYGHIDGVLARDWWRALLMTCFETGERAGALFSFRWDWLGRDGWLRVPSSVRKGRSKSREYHLRPHVVAALDRIREPKRDLIFPWDRHQATFYNRYERLLIRAGLPHGRRWKLQALRRSFASYCEAAGGDATRALAHTSRRTTVRSYLDPTITTRRPDSELLPLVGAVQ